MSRTTTTFTHIPKEYAMPDTDVNVNAEIHRLEHDLTILEADMASQGIKIDRAAETLANHTERLADIKDATKSAKDLPSAGDKEHVQAMFKIYGKPLPAISDGDWGKASQKVVKFKKLQATNAQLNRQNLIWHLQNPGKARMQKPHNTMPQVIKTNGGDLVIVDGHHRLSALRMLGLKKSPVWLLKESAT